MLGFAALSRLDLAQAAEAFDNAITRYPADPLPRIGQALIKIRRGDLAEGRRDIEIAVSLDPGNALARSYLGNAYFQERRDVVAAVELANAKVLDPLDPTPWLFDGLLKQSSNRPGEALKDIQTGAYAKQFILEGQSGYPEMTAHRRNNAAHDIEVVGERLRGMMSWINEGKIVDKNVN